MHTSTFSHCSTSSFVSVPRNGLKYLRSHTNIEVNFLNSRFSQSLRCESLISLSRRKRNFHMNASLSSGIENGENDSNDEIVHISILKENVKKEVWEFAVPALGAVLSDPLMSLIDTACVGQLGPIQLAALGPNVAIFNFIFQVFSFLGAATCNVIAGAESEILNNDDHNNSEEKASMMLSHSVLISSLLGTVTLILVVSFGPSLLKLMGTTKDFAGPAANYLYIRAVSVPAVLVMIVAQGACLGQQDSKTPLLIYTVAAVINIIGDYFLTLKLKWGVSGAAWATLGAQIVALACFLWKLKGRKLVSSLGLKEVESGGKRHPLIHLPSPKIKLGWYGLPSKESFEPFVTFAPPLILRTTLGMVIYSLLIRAAAREGMISLAAHQVAMQLFWTLSFVPEPLSLAAQSLVARDMKQNLLRAKHIARYLVLIAIGLGVLLSGITAAVTFFGSHLLSNDAEVLALVKAVAPQSIISQFICAVTLSIDGIALGSNDYSYLPAVQLINVMVVSTALYVSQKMQLGLGGVWWSMTIFFLVRLSLHILHVLTHWRTSVLGHY